MMTEGKKEEGNKHANTQNTIMLSTRGQASAGYPNMREEPIFTIQCLRNDIKGNKKKHDVLTHGMKMILYPVS